ncbi:MAG: response regulator [Oligoflexia bacterium]|nr:response regulator [Oligoflexia bacterium]
MNKQKNVNNSSDDSANNSASIDPQTKTILVVDDEPDISLIFTSELEEHGYKIMVASGGNEAYEVFKQNKVDLILSDIRMADGTGVDLLQKITADKEINSVPLILFMTGHSDISSEEAYNMGASALITKPIDINELSNSIKEHFCNKKTQLKKKFNSKDLHINFDIEFDGSAVTSNDVLSKLSLGNGGFFTPILEECKMPEPGSLIKFSLKDTSKNIGIIEGVGLVRWVRKKIIKELRKGIGVEFINLTDESIVNFLNFCNSKKTYRFIPNN